jgi:hypothetical protein
MERKKFKAYPIGYFHIDITEVRTAEGKLYLFVAIDRTSKFAYVELKRRAGKVWKQHSFSKISSRQFLIKSRKY